MGYGTPDGIQTAAEVVVSHGGRLEDGDLRKIVDALMLAGDREDSRVIAGLLRVVGSFGGRAKSFEGYVAAFSDNAVEEIKKAAVAALEKIRSSVPR